MGKINVAELLKDCPKGMELDCYLFNGLEFDHIDTDNKNYPIVCRVKSSKGVYDEHAFTKYGWYNFSYDYSKCVIFPKGKTTWEGFQKPFVDGDVVATDSGSVFILKSCLEDKIHYHSYIGVTYFNEIQEKQIPFAYKYVCHLATEEEKQKLFKVIKDNGYKWNEETKTLEKLVEPKFKVGDRITLKNCYKVGDKIILKNCNDEKPIYKITKVKNDCYETDQGELPFYYEDSWKLVPNKFDINTLVPFDSRVLVRHTKDNKWCASFFSHIDEDFHSHCYKFVTTAGKSYPYCIPYEGNQHLLGKVDDCDEYFKNW